MSFFVCQKFPNHRDKECIIFEDDFGGGMDDAIMPNDYQSEESSIQPQIRRTTTI